MVGLSWPLWIDGDDFPRIPFVRGWQGLPAGWSWSLLGLMVGALGAAAAGLARRPMLALGVGSVAFEVLGDQNRLQPWAYQFAIVGLGMAILPNRQALLLTRLEAISLYCYSGLSKLDASFLGELGPTFLSAGLDPLGFGTEGWSGTSRTLAILAMPVAEVAIGAGLACGATRRFALLGAVGLHLALFAILGPWNLGHSSNVLVWNAAMIVEDYFLFRARGNPSPPTKLGGPGRVLVAFCLVYPLGERFGWSDSWPSHALYASHCERTEVFLGEDALDRFPERVRRRTSTTGEGPWRRLDLTNWSRDVRGIPLYPQARVGNGIAEALASGPGGPLPVRVLQWSRANFWDGRRDVVECLGLRAIRRRGDRFRVNAHPVAAARP